MTSANKITFQADGSPYSKKFNDIYFDSESGCLQSEQVFIQGNKIKEKLLLAKNNITIAETGFGTGLNFLLTVKLYLELSSQADNTLPQLHFISTEKYPLTRAELKQSLNSLPQLAKFAELLVTNYPEQPKQSCELLFLNNKIKLTLLFADATQALTQLKTTKTGLVDAWYLDGFSPAKNPQMWQQPLFEQIARLSKSQASISTFTVAGTVRRSLISVGFRLEKKPYQGKKKHILTGVFQQGYHSGKGYQIRPTITKPQHVAIIGGGIASACAAYALTQAGIKVTLYCQDDKLGQGASSNLIGALYPLLHQQVDNISRFYQLAFQHARKWYDQLSQLGFTYQHDWCGLLEIAYKDPLKARQKTFEQLNAWPKTLINSIDEKQASQIAGIKLTHGGLFIPRAGWIAPQELVTALFCAAKSTQRLKIKTATKVKTITQLDNQQWQLNTNKGDYKASVLVLCGGADAIPLKMMKTLPLTSVQGQVTSVNSNDKMADLSTVICHKGYITPASNNLHCIGATFEKNSFSTTSTKAGDEYNLAMLEKCLPKLSQWSMADVHSSKARLRCMTPDHLPIVGALPDIKAHQTSYAHLAKDKNWRYQHSAPCLENIYTLTGLGARGLCTAPLLAEILAADLTGKPYPVDREMLFNLAPNRFVIRDIIKGKSF